MIPFKPSSILIERDVKTHPLTKLITKTFPSIPHSIIRHAASRPPGTSSSTLILAQHRGEVILPCPGTPDYLCCNYYILDIGFGCIYNCSYCFLHHYRNTPGLILYVNIGDALKILSNNIRKGILPFKRIGTGEFTDSLMLDHITGFSKKLVSYFSTKNIVLELKTKSIHIKNLMGLKHNQRTVIAWSLNPESIIRAEEPASASLKERMDAAGICQEEGYPIAFHFDPIIYSKQWEKEYKEVINLIKKKINPNRIVWISLGTLRFNPGLKPLIQRYFPKSDILYEEMIRGLDGKLRYIQPIRIEIYSKMYEWLKTTCPQTPIYLCMESPTVWKRSLGFCPKNPKEFENYIISYWNKTCR